MINDFVRQCSLVCLVMSALVFGSAMCNDDERILRITIQARGYDGVLLTNVPFVLCEGERRRASRTGESGTAVVEFKVANDAETLYVIVFPGGGRDGDVPEWTKDDRLAITRNFVEINKKYFFSRTSIIPLVQGRDEYDMEILGHPTVVASGVVVGPNDAPLPNAIIQGNSLTQIADASGRRRFMLAGVCKGKDVTLFVISRPHIFPVFVPGEKTETDFDLGKIVVPSLSDASAKIDPTIRNPKGLGTKTTYYGYRLGITLVSKDCSNVLAFNAQTTDDGVARLIAKPGEYWAVPPGEYYVVPGSFGRTDEQAAIIDALRRKLDLAQFNLPTITLMADKINSFDVDLLEAHRALSRLVTQLEETVPDRRD